MRVLMICGFLVLSSEPVDPTNLANPAKDNWQRVASIGMIIMGFDCLLWRKSDPDYLPGWYKRYFLFYFALFWFVLGSIVLILSWF